MTETVWRLRRALALGCLVLLGFGFASPILFAQQRVGVNSAVNPDAIGIPPGGLPKRVVLGQDVVFNERITTEAKGQTQVLFVDELTLSIGPNANMVIDQFVYDPNSGTGKLAASLARGVFRFVGGKISKLDNAVTLQTPSATIGIRGGVVLVRVSSNCGGGDCNALQVVFVYGKGVTITGLNGVSQTIYRPGFEVTVAKPGAAPSDPGPAPSERHDDDAGSTRRPRRQQRRGAEGPDRGNGREQWHRKRHFGQCASQRPGRGEDAAAAGTARERHPGDYSGPAQQPERPGFGGERHRDRWRDSFIQSVLGQPDGARYANPVRDSDNQPGDTNAPHNPDNPGNAEHPCDADDADHADDAEYAGNAAIAGGGLCRRLGQGHDYSANRRGL